MTEDDYRDKVPACGGEPAEDPEYHFIKTTCGRIAGGLVDTVSQEDLIGLARWAAAESEPRDTPENPF